ncbi:hypothetical protein BAU15_11150 [Enterococcus sp. JM4C]|uniref:replication initiation and membrane attachment family protein n=1 Tax=Candidatus Enterococcus huntleyi TaxID=1857217 RepID=UPI0013793B9D|nr:DnaD domain protein [Enterococcus sp. JM4C]KAF1298675.1 hypothetical protein BAU15_11150 [Enterococcus sp. JM4C]
MDSAWKEIQPKNIYQISQAIPHTDLAEKALLQLYQPIIGAQALSLYLLMVSEVNESNGLSPEALHAELLTMLNTGIPQFYEAKNKLEGIGLLETYKKVTPEVGTMFLYKLLSPMEPIEFFKDTVLSFHLLNSVGENKFHRLVQSFEPKSVDLTGYQPITKKFLEVYGWHNQELGDKNSQLEKVKDKFEQKAAKKTLATELNELNWEFMKELLDRKVGTSVSVEESAKEVFTLYHSMYGIDELKLVELSLPAVDLLTNTLEKKALQQHLSVANLPSHRQSEKETLEEESADDKTRRFNTLRQEGFSEKEIRLVKDSEEIPPMIYLEAMKAQKNGFVTKDETWLIQDLITQSALKNSVINVLVNYVLNIKNNPTLTRSFVNKIANDWSQLKIQTTEDAVRHLRTVKEEAAKKSERPTRRTSQKRVRREKLPEWLNKPQVEGPADTEKQEAINRRLQNFLAKKEGED